MVDHQHDIPKPAIRLEQLIGMMNVDLLYT